MEEGGVEALFDKNRHKPNIKNRIAPGIEEGVVAYALDDPAQGQTHIRNELRKQVTFVSSSGVRCILLRWQLGNFRGRLRALEEKSAREGFVPTEVSVAALRRKRSTEVSGEIETAHPGLAQFAGYV